jgi:hypothetical protein
MKHELVHYKGWGHCIRLSNKLVDLIIPTEIGPRIIRFGFLDHENEFYEDPHQADKREGDEWRMFGGHRLWHAPENMPRTYYPDNNPIHYDLLDGVLQLNQAVEVTTGIEKEIDIQLHEDYPKVNVVHRLRNCGIWDVELSPWALTVMASGGTALLPLPPRQSHAQNLLPSCTVTLWAYTDFSDPRWNFGPNYMMLDQDPECTGPQKVGTSNAEGWIAFLRNGHMFIKQFEYQTNANYPDMGCSAEVFTNEVMTEIETLGPLTKLTPGEVVEHVETWHLLNEFSRPKSPMAVREILDRIAAHLIG